jgi:AcrR family transcriptional regulator
MTTTSGPDAPAATGRRRLLELAADHVLEHGASDLSLSELARAVGSNNRMLLYYFGSKEEVLQQATLVAFERHPVLVGALHRLRTDPGPLRDRLLQVWADIAHPDNRPFLALFFQAFAVALYHPERNAELFQGLGGEWVTEVREALVADGVEAGAALVLATQLVTAWRGLQLSLLSGAPRELLDASYADLVERIAPPGNR